MISEPRELGTPKSGRRSLSFQKVLSELVSSASLSEKQMQINLKILMILSKKREIGADFTTECSMDSD